MKVGSTSSPLCAETVPVGQETKVASTNSFNVFNDGDAEVCIDVVAEVHDDRGNRNEITRSKVCVAVGQKIEEELHPFFETVYTEGVVTVTSSTVVSVSGDEGSTTMAERTMTVKPA